MKILQIPYVIILGLLATSGNADTEYDLVVVGARIFDGTKLIENIQNPAVYIKGEKIVAIRSFSPQGLAPNIKVIDAKGSTILPGLIDTHTHLGGTAGTRKLSEEFSQSTVLKRLKGYLYWGVTSIRSLGDDSRMSFPLKADIASGKTLGPDFYISGPTFTSSNGHPTEFFPIEGGVRAASVIELQKGEDPSSKILELKRLGADAIKVVYDSSPMGTPEHPHPAGVDLVTATRIIRIAHDNGLKAIAHVGHVKDAMEMLSANADSIEHIPKNPSGNPKAMSDLFDLMAQKKTFFTPTLTVIKGFIMNQHQADEELNRDIIRFSIPKVEFDSIQQAKPLEPIMSGPPIELMLRVANLAHIKGVKLVTGSDSGNRLNFHGYGLIRELKLLVQAGLSTHAAFTAATKTAAEAIGSDAGMIAIGKRANLIIVDGNPLDNINDIENIRTVILRGRPLSRDDVSLKSEYQRVGNP